jgi:hypothetical protein
MVVDRNNPPELITIDHLSVHFIAPS